MPREKLLCAARVDRNRRTVAGIAGGMCLPFEFAGLQVKRGDGLIGTADLHVHDAVFDQRMTGKAPHGHRRAVVLLKAGAPFERAVFGVEDAQVAMSAKRHDEAVGHRWRAARSARIAYAVVRGVFVLPDQVAGFLVEAKHAFDAVDLGFALRLVYDFAFGDDEVHHIDATVRDGRTRVAAVDRLTPFYWKAVGGNAIDNARFGVVSVERGAHPLRPVRRCGRHDHERQNGDG